MLRRVNYDTATVQLEPGDTLLLFTDGITEAMNLRLEEYGEERLIELLSARASSLSVEDLVGFRKRPRMSKALRHRMI